MERIDDTIDTEIWDQTEAKRRPLDDRAFRDWRWAVTGCRGEKLERLRTWRDQPVRGNSHGDGRFRRIINDTTRQVVRRVSLAWSNRWMREQTMGYRRSLGSWGGQEARDTWMSNYLHPLTVPRTVGDSLSSLKRVPIGHLRFHSTTRICAAPLFISSIPVVSHKFAHSFSKYPTRRHTRLTVHVVAIEIVSLFKTKLRKKDRFNEARDRWESNTPEPRSRTILFSLLETVDTYKGNAKRTVRSIKTHRRENRMAARIFFATSRAMTRPASGETAPEDTATKSACFFFASFFFFSRRQNIPLDVRDVLYDADANANLMQPRPISISVPPLFRHFFFPWVPRGPATKARGTERWNRRKGGPRKN